MRHLILIAVGLLSMAGRSYTVEEKLQVARYLVERLIYAPESIDSFDLNSEDEIAVSYPTYQSLFETAIPTNSVGFGWTAAEKQDAFEAFIRSIPRLAQNGNFPRLRGYGERALSFCSTHNVSNAMELAMAVLEQPENPCVGAALAVFRKRMVPSNAVTIVIENCVTNENISSDQGDYLTASYAAMLNKGMYTLDPLVLTNGVVMLSRLPVRFLGSQQIDKLLLNFTQEYAVSSNRLFRACETLRYIEAEKPFASESVEFYFRGITNQLLNTSQPLTEVEVLRGL